MYFRTTFFAAIITSQLLEPTLAAEAGPNEALLSTPNTCVALRQGRTCYSDITFSWQVGDADRYCIRQVNVKKPLYCWERSLNGNVNVEFASSSAQTYELLHVTTQKVLARSEVKVQWVYTSKQKKRRWRLF